MEGRAGHGVRGLDSDESWMNWDGREGPEQGPAAHVLSTGRQEGLAPHRAGASTDHSQEHQGESRSMLLTFCSESRRRRPRERKGKDAIG